MFRYVVIVMHFAFPTPIGGGRSVQSQLAAIGTHPTMMVMNVKSMKMTRKPIVALVMIWSRKHSVYIQMTTVQNFP